jgi:hypothetical protein
MKYLITESQIERLIFDYLDNRLKNLYEVEDTSGKFVWDSKESWSNSSRPIFSFYTRTGYLGILPNLIMELSSIFSLDPDDIIDMIILWVRDKTNLPISDFYIM